MVICPFSVTKPDFSSMYKYENSITTIIADKYECRIKTRHLNLETPRYCFDCTNSTDFLKAFAGGIMAPLINGGYYEWGPRGSPLRKGKHHLLQTQLFWANNGDSGFSRAFRNQSLGDLSKENIQALMIKMVFPQAASNPCRKTFSRYLHYLHPRKTALFAEYIRTMCLMYREYT